MPIMWCEQGYKKGEMVRYKCRICNIDLVVDDRKDDICNACDDHLKKQKEIVEGTKTHKERFNEEFKE